MNTKLLELIEQNARLSTEDLALMLDTTEEKVKAEIAEGEKDGTILGYKAMINWDNTENEHVNALIELRITPQPDRGFGKIAEKICNYPEVDSLYLMSGAYDLMVLLEGTTMREVALFVVKKLAPIDGVMSTATHFVLKKYKDKGITFRQQEVDPRGNMF